MFFIYFCGKEFRHGLKAWAGNTSPRKWQENLRKSSHWCNWDMKGSFHFKTLLMRKKLFYPPLKELNIGKGKWWKVRWPVGLCWIRYMYLQINRVVLVYQNLLSTSTIGNHKESKWIISYQYIYFHVSVEIWTLVLWPLCQCPYSCNRAHADPPYNFSHFKEYQTKQKVIFYLTKTSCFSWSCFGGCRRI